jgi:hypothetical protein
MPYGVKLLVHIQELNILAQLTGKPLDVIKEQTRCKPLPEFLADSGITPELFRTAMDEQALILIRQASAAKIISKEQAEEIVDMINKHAAYMEIGEWKRGIDSEP